MGMSAAYSFRGLTAEIDGRVLGIAGLMYSSPAQAFLSIKDELKKYPMVLARNADRFRDLLDTYDGMILAYPNPKEKTARRFLKWAGFEQIDEGIFRWVRRK